MRDASGAAAMLPGRDALHHMLVEAIFRRTPCALGAAAVLLSSSADAEAPEWCKTLTRPETEEVTVDWTAKDGRMLDTLTRAREVQSTKNGLPPPAPDGSSPLVFEVCLRAIEG